MLQRPAACCCGDGCGARMQKKHMIPANLPPPCLSVGAAVLLWQVGGRCCSESPNTGPLLLPAWQPLAAPLLTSLPRLLQLYYQQQRVRWARAANVFDVRWVCCHQPVCCTMLLPAAPAHQATLRGLAAGGAGAAAANPSRLGGQRSSWPHSYPNSFSASPAWQQVMAPA